MPKITDPDLLNQGTEIVFDTTNKTIQLIKAGNLSDAGVTGQCIYSFCKEEWNSDPNLIKFDFPMDPITEEKFDLVNGWDWKDTTTRNLIRDAGWCLRGSNKESLEEYMCFKSLGSMAGTEQIYYQQVNGGTATNVVLTGPANQAVKIYGDATHGNFNYRGFFKCFVRTQGKVYDQSQLSAIGVTNLTYQVYAFPLSTSVDLKITHTDNNIDTLAPYTGMTINWYGTNQARTIGAGSYNFTIIIGGNGGTKEQIYEFVQRELRRSSDIDDQAGVKTGNVTDKLLWFVGDTLYTAQGVFIDNFSAVDTNSIIFTDVTGTERTFPYTAAGKILFNENLVNDSNAIYRMYFSSGYGTSSAIIVKDSSNADISGSVSGRSEVSYTFDYDANVQGGRTAGTDATITVVAIGLSTGQYVKATGTIQKSKANIVSLVSALERNYVNPA